MNFDILKLRNNWLLFFLITSISIPIFSQSHEVKTEDKKQVRLSLKYVNYNNYGPRLITSVRMRQDGAYVSLGGVKINYYAVDRDREIPLGYAVSNNKGESVFGLPDTFYKPLDTLDRYQFIARIENSPVAIDTERDIELNRSKIQLEAFEEDSIKMLSFTILGINELGEFGPVEDVQVLVSVKRLFGQLILSEENTDANGKIEFVFPDDIPANSNSHLGIYVTVEDHTDFGTLVATIEKPWGVTATNSHILKRELWSAGSNAPLSLIIGISSMVLLIWVIIGFLIYEIFSIKHIGLVDN